MSLVTAQGIQARQDADRRVLALKGELEDLLSTRDLSVSEALSEFSADAEQTVREAIWRLLNEHRAEIVTGSRLHLIAS